MEHFIELKEILNKIEKEVPKLYDKKRKASGLRIRAYLKEINEVVRGFRAHTLSFEKEVGAEVSTNKDSTRKLYEENDDDNIIE